MSTHSAVDMTYRVIFSNSSSPKTKKSIFGEVTWHIKMTKRMAIWTFLILMRDKVDVAQFKFPINVAKIIFLIEIPKFLLLAHAYLAKTFLSLIGVSADKEFSWADSGAREGKEPPGWRSRYLALPSRSCSRFLAPGRFLPATTFSVWVFDYMLHHDSGKRLLVWSDIQWCNTLRVKVEKNIRATTNSSWSF